MKNIAVVTGASSGMGKEAVLQFSKEFSLDEIWVIARRKDKLLELKKSSKIRIRILCMDLTDSAALNKYRSVLKKSKPNIKVLANCAGFGRVNHYENESLNTYLNMIDLNIKALLSIVNYSLPYMSKGSHIMNVASASAFQPIPYINVYAATKAFVLNYSRALNMELKYRGIHVIAVCPYWVKTEFLDRAIAANSKQVVLHYGAIATKEAVIAKAIKDLKNNKDVSEYGILNKTQIVLAKIIPHSIVMNAWMWHQKLDGTRNIRRNKRNGK